jgi:hypothetical protein
VMTPENSSIRPPEAMLLIFEHNVYTARVTLLTSYCARGYIRWRIVWRVALFHGNEEVITRHHVGSCMWSKPAQ